MKIITMEMIHRCNAIIEQGENYDFELETHEKFDSIQDWFKSIYQTPTEKDIEYNSDENKNFSWCGGYDFFHKSHEVLYRLLFICDGIQANISDFENSQNFYEFVSPCKNFLIEIKTYRYHLSAFFYCRGKFLKGEYKKNLFGYPDADTGVYCSDKLGQEWFDCFVRIMVEMPKFEMKEGDIKF